MIRIILSRNIPENCWQVTYNGDGPYLISSTLEVAVEVVVAKLRRNNPHAQVSVKPDGALDKLFSQTT